jgi:signal transduction histidine kinase
MILGDARGKSAGAGFARWWPAVFFLTGVALASVVAAVAGLGTSDTVTVLFQSVLGAALAGLIAGVSLVSLRRTRLAVQASIAALAPIVAVAIGITWATWRMFITGHDLRVLWVVLASAGGAGMAASLLLAQRVRNASRSVGEMARILGEAGPGAIPANELGPSAPGELMALGDQLRRTSQLLAEAQARATSEEQTRRELVAWVSHDLRTPLSGIRAMVEALEDGVVADPKDVVRYHATMRLEVDRLSGLVDDLFELSRIQSGSLNLSTAPVRLDEILSDAIAGAAVSARAKGVDLRSDVTPPVPVVNVAAPEMIRVIRNLLDNAIRHTDAGGDVVIGSAVDRLGQMVRVSVLDGCGGIPASEIERVFEMGYRGDAARSPGEGRGGLGLAVAQGIVHAHAGQIEVSNEPGGCRFTVSIPMRNT